MKYCKIYFWACYIFLTMFVFSSCKDEIETPRFGSCKKIVNKNELEIYYNEEYSIKGIFNLKNIFTYYLSNRKWEAIKLKDIKFIVSHGKKYCVYKDLKYILKKRIVVLDSIKSEFNHLTYDNKGNNLYRNFLKINVDTDFIQFKWNYFKEETPNPKYAPLETLKYKFRLTETNKTILLYLNKLLLSKAYISNTDSSYNNTITINHNDSNMLYNWYYPTRLESDFRDERLLFTKYLYRILEENKNYYSKD